MISNSSDLTWIKNSRGRINDTARIRLGRRYVPHYRSRPGAGHRRGRSRVYCDMASGRGSGIRRTVVGGFFVQETGLRNGACGADKFGFKDLAAVHWNLTAPTLYEHAIAAQAKARSSRAARSAPRPASIPAAARRTSSPSSMRSPRTRSGGTGTASSRRRTSTCCSPTSSSTPAARSSTRRTSTAAPIRNTASRRASSPSLPGTRCSSASC